MAGSVSGMQPHEVVFRRGILTSEVHRVLTCYVLRFREAFQVCRVVGTSSDALTC